MTGLGDRPLVVVGADDSPDSATAARWVLGLLGSRHPRLRLVHIPAGADDPTHAPDWLCRQVRALSADVLVVQPPAGCATGTEVATVLAEGAGAADLLVVGSYGEGSGGGAKVGSTALELLNRAPCPVAVVRGREPGAAPPEDGPVVVGYDGTPVSDRALALAADLAETVKAPLRITHTWTEFALDPVEGSYPARESWDALARQAAARVDAAARTVHERHPTVEVQRCVFGDTPLRALLDAATEARVVVVGRHRAPAPTHRRLGSTSLGLVEFAPCPVVVIPPLEQTRDAQ